jgi:4-hydroxy-4-methyl-2-oxoglutarate aldolase
MTMNDRLPDFARSLTGLSAAHIADACAAMAVTLRIAPIGIRPLFVPSRFVGRVAPAVHRGSVDVFFEALAAAAPGDVLVIDNGGRTDEGCIGDLTVLEADAYGMAGVVVWGAHRDSAELREIALPVYSLGSCPAGPRGVRSGGDDRCMIGEAEITAEDIAIGDEDGVLFIAANVLESVIQAARMIAATEQSQRRALAAGTTLHQQFEWDQYAWRRRADPSYTFRHHLLKINKAIET